MANLKNVLLTTKNLVHFSSYSGQEKPAMDYIGAELTKAGGCPFFQDENLILHLKGTNQTKAFLFNGHIDVVDIGEEKRWYHHPWNGNIENGRIYGRGTSDMKAGVASMIELAKMLLGKKNLPCDIWFVFVTKEETDSEGTKAFCRWFLDQGYPAKYQEMAAVFPEPTGFTKIGNGSRGNFFLKITIEGEAGHSSMPKAIKRNAIAELSEILTTLKTTNQKWEKRFCNSCFAAPTITPTAIESKSDSPNKVAEKVEVACDLRTIPEFHDQAYDEIKKKLHREGVAITLAYPEAPPSYTQPNSKIIKALEKILPLIETKTCAYATDMGFTNKLGIKGVILGPGEENQAHTIDESASVEQILAAPEIYAKLYYEWAES